MPGHLGQLLRYVARGLVHCYYGQVEISDGQRIRPTGPVLLCANHPNSLLDPVVVGLAATRPVRFFAKAPLFQKPVLGTVMRALGMIPAYRGVDDSRQVRQNLESLDRCIEALQQGDAVGIFPEGKSHDEIGVEMVRGGAARVALQAFAGGAVNLQVVPIGLNYENKERFLSSVWVSVGEPMLLREWVQPHQQAGEHERQTLRCFTQELQQRLQQVTIHLNDQRWQEWLNDLEHLAPEIPLAAATAVPQLRRRKYIADAMNYFLEHDPERAAAVADDIGRFRDAARAVGLTPAATVLRSGPFAAWLRLCLTWITLAIAAIPAALGIAFHAVPFWLTRLIARRFTPPGHTAVSFYRLLVGFPTFLTWYLVALGVLLWQLPRVRAVSIWLVLPLLGIFAVHYWGFARHAWQELWSQFRALIAPHRVRQLQDRRQKLQLQLQQLAQDYRSQLTATVNRS